MTVTLNPFFSYFGSKYRLAKYYPKPQYEEIIEPFAGSAGYSLRYPNKKVILYDIYEPIVELWDYLISVTEDEILSLPLGPFNKDHPVENEIRCVPARTLVGFWLTESQTSPSRYPLSKSRGGNWTERKRNLIASQLKYIRHWRVEKLEYGEIPNRYATWFVDPPYEEAGKRYKRNNISYLNLGEWCRERNGQAIVCEQNNAQWLEFTSLDTKLKIRNASNNNYKELLWHSTN